MTAFEEIRDVASTEIRGAIDDGFKLGIKAAINLAKKVAEQMPDDQSMPLRVFADALIELAMTNITQPTEEKS